MELFCDYVRNRKSSIRHFLILPEFQVFLFRRKSVFGRFGKDVLILIISKFLNVFLFRT